jgi:cystathionine beta-lyase
MGLAACKAAYSQGREWLEELKIYLCGNLDLLRNYLKQHIPQVKLVEPQGTYLVWLDFKALGLSDNELDDLIVRKARLWLDEGTMFGAGGEGFA